MLRFAVCAVALLALGLPLSADVPKDKGEPKGKAPAKKKAHDAPLSRAELARRLQTVIDMKDFQQPMTLKECLGLLSDKVDARFGEEHALPILLDSDAFKADSPDIPDVYDTPVKFPPFPRRMTAATVLRLAVSKVPTNDATYLLRNGAVEITTAKRASTGRLLREKVAASFDKTPLAEAIEELSDATGLSIALDGRAGDKLKLPVTASFNNDATAGAALKIITDMADLKVVLLDGGVYVTTPANAAALEKERRAAAEERRKKMFGGPIPQTGAK